MIRAEMGREMIREMHRSSEKGAAGEAEKKLLFSEPQTLSEASKRLEAAKLNSCEDQS